MFIQDEDDLEDCLCKSFFRMMMIWKTVFVKVSSGWRWYGRCLCKLLLFIRTISVL